MSEGLPVVVVGGGPSGLACAWELARQGRSTIVLEKEDRAGGLCATHEKDGYRFDLGGHRFVSSNADLARRVRALLGDDLLEQERRSVVLHGGRAFKYPLEARDLVRSLGLRENARAFGGYAIERVRQRFLPSEDRTFEEWVRARFGGPLYETFFGPYTEKLWGLSPGDISSDWAAQRIGLLNLGDAALRMLGARRPPIRTYARKYWYPKLGMGQLFDSLANDVTRMGARIELGAEVIGFETRGDQVTSVRARIRGHESRILCSHVYATSPLTEISRGLGPPRVSADVARARDRLTFRALRFVNLMLDRASVSENTWMYVADPRFTITRIQEPRHRSAWMCPPGKTSAMLEIACNKGDATWEADDRELVERALSELDRLGFPVRAHLTGYFTVKVPCGYPIYHVGYDDDRATVLSHVSSYSNLIAGGRQGLFRYIFLDAAMEMGELAAQQILCGSVDARRIDAVRRERVLLEGTAITA